MTLPREVIEAELEKATAYSNSGLTASNLLAYVRKHPDSPLQALYNWNEKEAAEEHWLAVSRQIIRAYRVRVRMTPVVHTTVRALIAVRAEPADLERSYVSRESVLKNSAWRAQRVQRGWKLLHSFFTEFHDLTEFDAVRAAIAPFLELGEAAE